MTPKMEFFNFGLEQKLDRHFCVEFHSDSNDDGFNFSKPQLNPPKCPLGGGGSAVSGMDGITLTDMGGGWVLSPCDQIAADANWTKKFMEFQNYQI